MQILILICLLALSFTGCKKKEKEPTHFRGIAMTMPYDVQISEKISEKQKETIRACLSNIFSQIDLSINHWNPKAEVNNLRQSEQRVTDHLKTVLSHSKFVHSLSNARYDPTLYHEIKKWKDSLSLGILPESNHPSFSSFIDKVHLKGHALSLDEKDIKFDFDGITKGYTVDLIVSTLKDMGYKNIFVNWSGEIKAVGKYDSKRAWKVLVANPEDLNGTQKIFDLDGMAIATSGDYEQAWLVDEKIYTHFVSPKTLLAKEITNSSLVSVTVLYKSCAIADALATAAMTFDNKNELLEWISFVESQLKDVKFWVFFHGSEKQD